MSLLALAAPFEATEPLVRLRWQSVSNLEAALLVAFAAWGAAILVSRRALEWRTPLTAPWIAMLAAMAVAAAASPISRLNALHMTGRFTAAFGVYLLAVNGLTTRARVRTVLALAVLAGVIVSVLAILEYLQVGAVLAWLKTFRPGLSTVGAQVRAGGPLQYPTIASMYLEVVFAFGLGLLLSELDDARRRSVIVLFLALLVIAEAITLTFTRAGLIAIAAILVLVGVVRQRQRAPGRVAPLGQVPDGWGPRRGPGDRGPRRGIDAGVLAVATLAVLIAGLVLASRSSQFLWLRLTSEGQESWYRMSIAAPPEVSLAPDGTVSIPIAITNTGRLVWDSFDEPPFFLSYHWLSATGDRVVTYDGARTAFAAPVSPATTVSMLARVRAPRQPGQYRLVWDVVQEGRLWFTTEPGAAVTISRAIVTGPAVAAPIGTSSPPRPAVRPGRLVLWRAAARMFRAHPILGVGADNFRLAYGDYVGLPAFDQRTHSNNMYLEVLVGCGAAGGLAFLWLIWSAAGCALADLRAATRRSASAAIGFAAAMLAIALHALVDSFLSFGPTYVLFSLTLGLAVAGARGMETPRVDRHANCV